MPMVLITIKGKGNITPVSKHDIMEAYRYMEESPSHYINCHNLNSHFSYMSWKFFHNQKTQGCVGHRMSLDVMVKKILTYRIQTPTLQPTVTHFSITKLFWLIIKFIIINNIRFCLSLKASKLNWHSNYPNTKYYPGKWILRYDWSGIGSAYISNSIWMNFLLWFMLLKKVCTFYHNSYSTH